MSRPLISIVLPTYNGSSYLRESVESCLTQTYGNLELIIVDDASTDETSAMCRHLVSKDQRIRLVRHDTNRKLPAALNTGFSLARGEFLTWTSDDNCYKPQALEVMAEFLSGHSDVGIVYCGYETIDENGFITGNVSARKPQNLVSENIVGPCFLYRRQVQELLEGYDTTIFLAEDFDFWLRASVHFKMAPMLESPYLYRKHSASLSHLHRRQIDLSHRIALRRSLPDMLWLSPRMQAIGWLNLAAYAWSAKDLKDFRRCLEQAINSSLLITLLVAIKVLLGGRRIVREKPLWIPNWLNDGENNYKLQ
jgi:glycosyltransferase involved in cell wall biosynthesis